MMRFNSIYAAWGQSEDAFKARPLMRFFLNRIRSGNYFYIMIHNMPSVQHFPLVPKVKQCHEKALFYVRITLKKETNHAKNFS